MRRLAEVRDQLHYILSHLPKENDGMVQSRKLPEPSIGAFRLKQSGDQRISHCDQIRKRAELNNPVFVARSFGICVSTGVRLIIGFGFAFPWMTRVAGILECFN